MRNPRFHRNLGLAIALSGVAACAAARLLPAGMAGDAVRTALVAYGATAALLGAGSAFWSHRLWRAQQSLAAGGDVLARWRIDAATWRKFVERNAALNDESGLVNELSIRDTIPDDGVAIVVGREAVQVDDSIHDIPLRGTPEVTQALLVQDAVDYIELRLRYPGTGGGASGVPQGPTRSALRFPVAATSWRDARAIVAHFNRVGPQKADFFHGRGDGSDAEDLNTCIACGYQAYKFSSECPRCGAGMLTLRWGRRFGAVVALGGLFITGMIGAVIFNTAPTLLHPGRSYDGTRFDGSALLGISIFAFFLAVLAFGITMLLYGAWQVKTGKRDKRIVYAIALLLGVVMIFVTLIR